MKDVKKREIYWLRLAVIEHFDCILFPFEVATFLEELPTLGYIVPDEAERAALGKRLSKVGTRGNIYLQLDTANRTLGVQARTTEDAVNSFRTIRSFCEERLDPSVGFRTRYVEISANGWVDARGDARKNLDKAWSDAPILERIGKVLDQDQVSNLGVVVCSPGLNAESPDWFNLGIRPLHSSKNRYHIEVVLRKPDLEEVLKKTQNLDAIILEMVEEIERFAEGKK